MQKLFLFFICVMVNPMLHGMERILSNEVVLEALITSRLSNDDYDTYRTIAMLSTAHNKFIEEKYRPIKKCIEQSFSYQSSFTEKMKPTISWNKDFSKCACVSIYEGTDTWSSEKNLYLSLWSTRKYKKDEQEYVKIDDALGRWGKLECPVFEDNVRPFFNKEGRACFYGYGQIKTGQEYSYHWMDGDVSRPEDTFKSGLLEYSIDSDRNQKCCFGVFRLNWLDNHRTFAALLNFPVLVRALLQSKLVEQSKETNGVITNTYDIRNVLLPEDYKTFKQHVAWQQSKCNYDKNRYISYESLPNDVRNAIDKRYEAQKNEKPLMELIRNGNLNADTLYEILPDCMKTAFAERHAEMQQEKKVTEVQDDERNDI